MGDFVSETVGQHGGIFRRRFDRLPPHPLGGFKRIVVPSSPLMLRTGSPSIGNAAILGTDGFGEVEGR